MDSDTEGERDMKRKRRKVRVRVKVLQLLRGGRSRVGRSLCHQVRDRLGRLSHYY